MIQIIIVDDHPMVVDGLKSSFLRHADIEVIATAGSGAECRRVLGTNSPDVVLMDLRLPDVEGIDLVLDILKKFPDLKIIVLTSNQQRFYIQSLIESGIKGYLLKSADFSEILAAVRTVAEGGKHFSSEVEKQFAADKEKQLFLTKRELEVLQLIAAGLTNPEIADKLFISPLTVDSHRKNLLFKFNAKNTASMISEAVGQGYL
jgi:DNA-binding NarL/FixJ family response regulator